MEKADDPTLVKVAKEVGKETTQVLIRWSLQKGYVAAFAGGILRSEISS
jgi:diketogulonate reductase-like aldo/keto reductase